MLLTDPRYRVCPQYSQDIGVILEDYDNNRRIFQHIFQHITLQQHHTSSKDQRRHWTSLVHITELDINQRRTP